MRVIGVVLAAGAGRRIGGCKALLRTEGRSFLARCVERLSQPGVEAVVAVLGAEAAAVAREAEGLAGLECLVNPGHAEGGMLSSMLAGLEAAERRGADAVLVHPVDHPLVGAATVARVVAALGEGAGIAVPSWEGRRGHPVGFASRFWPALRSAPPERGARQVLASHPGDVVHVRGDPGCRTGVDTPEDYRRAFGGEPQRV